LETGQRVAGAPEEEVIHEELKKTTKKVSGGKSVFGKGFEARRGGEG